MGFFMKATLRQHYRQLRRSISSEEKITYSKKLVEIFFQYFQSYKNIAVYLAHDGEIDLSFLIEVLWKKRCNLFLPVINVTTQHLQFSAYSPSTILKKNSYGINEPADDFFLASEDLDIVLMPLVAFDKTGARLGMGKGFYDQTFAGKNLLNKPKLIGVAYSYQYCDKLPVESWDVSLNGVLTEKELLMFTGKL